METGAHSTGLNVNAGNTKEKSEVITKITGPLFGSENGH
jgi:hypothetical protein